MDGVRRAWGTCGIGYEVRIEYGVWGGYACYKHSSRCRRRAYNFAFVVLVRVGQLQLVCDSWYWQGWGMFVHVGMPTYGWVCIRHRRAYNFAFVYEKCQKIELENANAPMCVGADAMGGVASASPSHFVPLLALIASLSAL